MKYLLLCGFLFFLSACATGPGKKALRPEYSENIHPVHRLVAAEKKCRAPQADEISWQEQLVKANGCWLSADWRNLRLWGKKLLEEHPQAPWGMYYLSVVETEAGRFSLASWMIERALDLAPNSALVMMQKAQVLWRQGEESQAVGLVQQAVKMEEKLIEGHLFLGQVALRNLQKEKAIAHFEKALKLDPTHPEAAKQLQQLVKKPQMVIGRHIKEENRQ